MTTTQKHRFSAGSRPVTAALVLSAVFAVLVLLPGIRPAAAPYRTVTSAVGLEVRYANGEWRTFDGSEPVNYTGVAHNAAGWWFCRNGTVDFNYTGIQPNDAGWWRIVGGKVDFGCNTIEHIQHRADQVIDAGDVDRVNLAILGHERESGILSHFFMLPSHQFVCVLRTGRAPCPLCKRLSGNPLRFLPASF